MFTLQFKKSISKKYSLAVEKAKELGGVVASDQVTIKIEDYEMLYAYEKLYPLLAIIQKWKGTSAEYNGKKVDPFKFVFQGWYSVRQCAEQKNGDWDTRYCWKDYDQEGWGCKKLSPFLRHFSGSGEYKKSNQFWYNFGEFDDQKNWIINKNLIMQKLIQTSENSCLKLCPFFDIVKVKKMVDELPDIIIADGINFRPFYQEGKMVNVRHCKPLLISLDHIISAPRAKFIDICLLNQVDHLVRKKSSFEISQN